MTLPVIIGVARRRVGPSYAVSIVLTQLRQLGDNRVGRYRRAAENAGTISSRTWSAVVQGHAGYERSTLEAVVAARRARACKRRQAGPADPARAERRPARERPAARPWRSPRRTRSSKRPRSFASLQATLTDVEDHLQKRAGAITQRGRFAISIPPSAQFPSGIIRRDDAPQAHGNSLVWTIPRKRAVPKVPLILLFPRAPRQHRSVRNARTRSSASTRGIRVNAERQHRTSPNRSPHSSSVSYNGLFRVHPHQIPQRTGTELDAWRLAAERPRTTQGHDLPHRGRHAQGASMK